MSYGKERGKHLRLYTVHIDQVRERFGYPTYVRSVQCLPNLEIRGL